jgi:hypothetical protein
VSVVQGLLSLQSAGTQGIGLHNPSAGSQGKSNGHCTATLWTHPVAGLHESVVQALLSLQFNGVPAVQMPFWQVSLMVQALPSLQLVPLVLLVTGHIPVDGTHAPTVMQAVGAGHVTGTPATQTPFWHVSIPLQRLPSLQGVPSGCPVHAVMDAVTLRMRWLDSSAM